MGRQENIHKDGKTENILIEGENKTIYTWKMKTREYTHRRGEQENIHIEEENKRIYTWK